jgi:hypothetical protein
MQVHLGFDTLWGRGRGDLRSPAMKRKKTNDALCFAGFSSLLLRKENIRCAGWAIRAAFCVGADGRNAPSRRTNGG